MSIHNIVDHRAPWFFPHEVESHMSTMALLLVNIFGGLLGGVVALIVAQVSIIPLILWATFIAGFNIYFRRWVYNIPTDKTDGLTAYNINGDIQVIQKMYKNNPTARAGIEPMVISSYDYARKGDLKAVRNRKGAISEYINTIPKAIAPVDEELENFKTMIEIRKDMQREGLL